MMDLNTSSTKIRESKCVSKNEERHKMKFLKDYGDVFGQDELLDLNTLNFGDNETW